MRSDGQFRTEAFIDFRGGLCRAAQSSAYPLVRVKDQGTFLYGHVRVSSYTPSKIPVSRSFFWCIDLSVTSEVSRT